MRTKQLEGPRICFFFFSIFIKTTELLKIKRESQMKTINCKKLHFFFRGKFSTNLKF